MPGFSRRLVRPINLFDCVFSYFQQKRRQPKLFCFVFKHFSVSNKRILNHRVKTKFNTPSAYAHTHNRTLLCYLTHAHFCRVGSQWAENWPTRRAMRDQNVFTWAHAVGWMGHMKICLIRISIGFFIELGFNGNKLTNYYICFGVFGLCITCNPLGTDP